MARTQKAPAKTAASKTAAPAKKTAKKAASGTSAPAKKTTTPKKEKSVAKKKLEVGDPVKVSVDPRQNGGESVAHGLVTKAGEESVNVTVFLDSEENQWLQNVSVVKSEPKEDDEVNGRVCWPA